MAEAPGRLETIWIKRAKRGPMDPRPRASVLSGRGLADNANQGGKRQITILSVEAWKKAEEALGAEVPPESRRANLFVSGVELENGRGRTLVVGPVRLQIYGETRPCERMDEAFAGLRSALGPDWCGGCFGEALDDGEIAVGDPVRWLDS
jgi:MOSC domain-containing protein YiiM